MIVLRAYYVLCIFLEVFYHDHSYPKYYLNNIRSILRFAVVI